ncbi:MAG: hypothetical protein H7A49_12545 [Akkermansiaceae bacterium]|nr:hypothetical protein [Akkermansiaceae bacterium]MCP5544724.1 hypothetical protein [Akkermansiaceae bacterium]MCP5545864.1 hypothetical protein [Akkermansiaceae bacterium]
MKLSIALTLVILTIAAALGWRGRQELSEVRRTHQKLVAEAAELGISSDSARAGGGPLATKRGIREDKQAEAKQAAAEFIAFAREMEDVEKRGQQPDPETMKRIMTFMDRMLSLDGEQLKAVIQAVRDEPNLKDETRQGLIMFSIMSLASDHPRAAVSLFTESSDLLGDQGEMMGKHIVGSALATWAKDDPMGALEWVRKNGESHPDLVNDETKASLLSGVASKDPALAFDLLGQLYGKAELDAHSDPGTAISRITGAARTPEERTATLAALRAYAAARASDSMREGALHGGLRSLTFGSGYRNAGYESTTTWLDSANLTPAELTAATQNIEHSVRLEDSGRWIEWLGRSDLPEKKSNERIHRLASEWTREDYQAAGQWLATAPDSSAKQTAVQAYAQTVFPYEPDIAVQWANTLPAGKTRQQTFEAIHKSMPRNSDAEKAAAEAFATEHGIEKP